MATTTPNYNLKKPSLNDFFNVQDFNDNTDVIDEELEKANEQIENVKQTTYTKQQVDKFLNDIDESSYWKASVDTFDDIATTYPTPKQGWAVSVKDTNRTYRYNGSAWIDVFSLISKAELGLDKVDNTSDLEKPISTATQKALNTLTSNVNSLSNTKANAADVYSKTEIDSKFGNASTSVSGLEEKVNTNTSNIAANTANIGKISGKVGELTTLSTDDKTDLVKSINEVNSKANNNATSIAGLNSSKANAADVYTKTETDTKLSTKSDSSHTHDVRYYTETEIDNKLSTKSDSTHNHDSSYYKKSETYTKSEINNSLSEKSDTSHTHDERYYTETEVDSKVSNLSKKIDSNTLHRNNADIHVTSTEKDKWNNYPNTIIPTAKLRTETLKLKNIQLEDYPFWKELPNLDTRFYNGKAVVLNGEIHILGGEGNKTMHYKFNGESWESVSTLPYEFYMGVAIVLDDEIHIMGGGQYNSNSVYNHYKWNGNSWESVSTLPYKLFNGSAFIINGEIHVFGFYVNDEGKGHFKWNRTSWESVSTPPCTVNETMAVELNGEIHIIGSSINHCKWNGTSWEQNVSTPPFYYGVTFVQNGEIHIIGGTSNTSHFVKNNNNHYKWNGISWESLPKAPYGLYQSSVVELNDKIFVIGGMDCTDMMSGTTTYYSKYFYTYYIDANSKTVKNMEFENSRGEITTFNWSNMGEYNKVCDNDYVFGNNNIAQGNQMVIGHYNSAKTAGSSSGNSGSAFIIGKGTSSSSENAFRVQYNGAVYGLSSYNSSGADYSEYFEWADGNEDNEDRVGYFVTFDDNKTIRKANASDDYILGIVSGLPCIIGNSDEDWRGRYILDDFGRFIEETFEYSEKIKNEETGKEKVVVKIGTRYKENPEYNPNQQYIERAKRKEWSAIGMIGVLSVYDDGTCQVNGYCTATDGGIATACDYGLNSYRVLERVTDNIVKVLFK